MRKILLVLIFLTACKNSSKPQQTAPPAPPQPQTKVAPATPLDVKKAELGGETWDPAWDQLVERDLPPEMLTRRVPRDVRRWCPRFYTMSEADKRAWWAYFFQALASAEAGLKPTVVVHHLQPEVNQIDSITHERIRQEGLLQLTYQDAERYGCDFDWQADRKLPLKSPERSILKPENNLKCGIRILTNQIFTLHKPLYTRTSYWATLQPGTESFRVFEKQMTNPPAACGLRPGSGHPTTAIVDAQANQH